MQHDRTSTNAFFHSVYVDRARCNGCSHCLKFCPTQAIRVRNGKAQITDKFCIDCGECVRKCVRRAKRCSYNTLEVLKNYEYNVAVPSHALYAQFNNLNDLNILATALLDLGFDAVSDIGLSKDLVDRAAAEYIAEHPEGRPFINAYCFTIVRLIRVRFPNLVDHLLPIRQPLEVAAELALDKAMKETGLPAEKIGIIHISPCPSTIAYARSPLGVRTSALNGNIAISYLYPKLLPLLKEAEKAPRKVFDPETVRIGWIDSGGYNKDGLPDNRLTADGLENVLKILEDLENDKYQDYDYIDLHACQGSCLGGALTVENPYVARERMRRLSANLGQKPYTDIANYNPPIYWDEKIEYNDVYRLGKTMTEGISLLRSVESLTRHFPGFNCGSCGAPTCRALAEDIVRGTASINDCIYIYRDTIHELTEEIDRISSEITRMRGQQNIEPSTLKLLQSQIDQLWVEMLSLDVEFSRKSEYSDIKKIYDNE